MPVSPPSIPSFPSLPQPVSIYYAILLYCIIAHYSILPPCKFLCINLVRYPRDTHRLFEDAASKITI